MLREIIKKLWVMTRPAPIQELIRRFPIGTVFSDSGSGALAYLVGYCDDHILVSWNDPAVEYRLAVDTAFPVPVSALDKAVTCH